MTVCLAVNELGSQWTEPVLRKLPRAPRSQEDAG